MAVKSAKLYIIWYILIRMFELEIDFVKLSSRRSKMSRLIINLSKHEINSFLEIKGVNIPSGHHRPYHMAYISMIHMLWHFI